MTAINLDRWYLTLTPPALSPPGWVLAPLAAVAYVLIGIAAWLVWRQPEAAWRQHRALLAWGWALGLNAIWTPLFFGLHLILPALMVMLGLFALTVFTAVRFFSINRRAALLMLPYAASVGFVAYLNAGFWWLNA